MATGRSSNNNYCLIISGQSVINNVSVSLSHHCWGQYSGWQIQYTIIIIVKKCPALESCQSGIHCWLWRGDSEVAGTHSPSSPPVTHILPIIIIQPVSLLSSACLGCYLNTTPALYCTGTHCCTVTPRHCAALPSPRGPITLPTLNTQHQDGDC